ncbi:DNA polymerase IV [Alkanindiges illinoisensis]|uniref:DNA polymerase IV n=1 Tax=Alkanindiges illinoisensis TaxID=197183 RepID=UPI000AA10311|nr:DNA polymerase IV [Alkanindiges illinoisensis]
MRKIVHIDMDAFYASVEIRDQPDLRGQPVVVAWDGPRSVICAASYEARQFGLRSAMSVARAKQLCPHAIYITPSFDKYREVSRQVHDIFHQYTDLIEPLSLDEAYLDVTRNFKNLPTATDVAQAIRAEIFAQTRLTASAGVAPNKFLAKIASDWNKPNGLCVIKPSQVTQFLPNLPVGKIPGVGQVTLQRMQILNIQTVGELAQHSQAELAHHFGRYGYRLYDLARGIDERPVNASRERQQISKETTFSEDKFLPELGEHWHHLAHQVWEQMQKKQMSARTVTIKLKTSQFKTITRSVTYSSHIPHYTEFQAAVLLMIERLTPELNHQLMFRLAGVGVGELALQQQQAQLRLLE